MPDSESSLGSCVDHATRMYCRVTEQLFTMNAHFDFVTPVGSLRSSGEGLELSLSEMIAARRSIAWALESWTTCGTLPDVDQLYSHVQNSGGSQVAIIYTFSLLAQGAGLLALLVGGYVDMVSQEFASLCLTEEPPVTAVNTSQKISTPLASGISSPPPQRENTDSWVQRAKRAKARADRAGSSTRTKSIVKLKKKNKRKVSTRKGLKQKKTGKAAAAARK